MTPALKELTVWQREIKWIVALLCDKRSNEDPCWRQEVHWLGWRRGLLADHAPLFFRQDKGSEGRRPRPDWAPAVVRAPFVQTQTLLPVRTSQCFPVSLQSKRFLKANPWVYHSEEQYICTVYNIHISVCTVLCHIAFSLQTSVIQKSSYLVLAKLRFLLDIIYMTVFVMMVFLFYFKSSCLRLACLCL